MPITIVRLLAFEGPNLYGPQPGVALLARAERDWGGPLRAALKDGALSVGVVLAQLEVAARPAPEGTLLELHALTPTPGLAADLLRAVVDGLNARAAGDEWDAEEALWALQRRRRAEALPLWALQICAEAQARGVPFFLRQDGALQFGYGARGRQLAVQRADGQAGLLSPDAVGVGRPRESGSEAADALPWDRLGPIPAVAISGGPAGGAAARRLAGLLAAERPGVAAAEAAGFDEARALLADPRVSLAVLGLEPGDLARRGSPCERYAACALLGLPDPPPPELPDRAELARALGVPLLLTDPGGLAALNADEPELLALAEYAPCPLALLSLRPDSPAVAAHRARGGAALFLRGGAIVAAQGPAEQTAGPAPAEQPLAELAALALRACIKRET